MWHFTITEPHKEPKLVKLKPGKHAIGRSWDNDIKIKDDSVSRHHAQVLIDPATDTVCIIDLNSTNGIYVNGQRIQGVVSLAAKDNILIGETDMFLAYSPNKKTAIEDHALETHLFMPELMHQSVEQYPVVVYESLWDS